MGSSQTAIAKTSHTKVNLERLYTMERKLSRVGSNADSAIGEEEITIDERSTMRYDRPSIAGVTLNCARYETQSQKTFKSPSKTRWFVARSNIFQKAIEKLRVSDFRGSS